MQVLAVFAGLPGVGKSTLAEQVGTALPAAVLAVDTVDFTMSAYDVTEPRPGQCQADYECPSGRCRWDTKVCSQQMCWGQCES